MLPLILGAIGLGAIALLAKKGKGGRTRTRRYCFRWRGRVHCFTTLARAQYRYHELRSQRRRR